MDSEKNVIVVVFNVESEGFQALSELKQVANGASYSISAAGLVKKEGDEYKLLDGFDTGANTADDTVLGGLLGMTLGILGGPLGVLLGGSYGALVGASVDSIETTLGVSMLDQMVDKLDDGMVALIALVDEETPMTIDAKLDKYDAVIARFDAETIADEVGVAYEKQLEMERQEFIDRHNERKNIIHTKLAEMKKELKDTFSEE